MSSMSNGPRCPRCGARAQWTDDGAEFGIANELYCPNGCYSVSFDHSRKKALKKWTELTREYSAKHRPERDSDKFN